MRRPDETPLDPEVLESLEAIDATLAGEPVDPLHAELAELSLLLAAERPQLSASAAASLDDRVERRFPPASRAGASVGKRPRLGWLWAPAVGVAVVAAVAIVLAVSPGPSGAPVHNAVTTSSAGSAASLPRAAFGSASGTASTPAPAYRPPGVPAPAAGVPAPAVRTPLLSPSPSARKVIQGAQLALSTAPSRIETVAQEVFAVVGQQRGIVQSSTVTATGGADGYAQFQLSIPGASLSQTMASLSTLRYAHVASRTDTTQDVNDQYQSVVRSLADARALRTSLLKQLASATTTAQIQSLTAQIHDAEASISSDEATLRRLNRQVGFSQVTLTINGGSGLVPVPGPASGGGFTLGRALHDAGRVLTVAAGVAVIAAAALVPVALLGALAWWALVTLRRHRRERALDLA
jgi:hypothetical protein